MDPMFRISRFGFLSGLGFRLNLDPGCPTFLGVYPVNM